MNAGFALIVWFFVILIIFFIFWYLSCYSAWKSLAMATLISLIVLIVLFPWNLEHHHRDADCDRPGESAFFIILVISVVIIIAYFLSTYMYCESEDEVIIVKT